MKNISKLILLLLTITMLSACAKTTSVRHHKDFQNHLSQAKQLALLPAIVNVVTVDSFGKTSRNYNYESQVEDVIIDVLRPILVNKGYKTVFLNRREIHNNKLSKSLLAFREEYDKKIKTLYATPLWVEEKAYSVELFLDRKVNDVSKLTESELIIFVEYALRAKTSGACTSQFTKSMLSAALLGTSTSNPEDDAAEVLSLRLAVVDANNGRFIWSNSTKTFYSMFSGMFSGKKSNQTVESDRLKELFKLLLEGLPNRNKGK